MYFNSTFYLFIPNIKRWLDVRIASIEFEISILEIPQCYPGNTICTMESERERERERGVNKKEREIES